MKDDLGKQGTVGLITYMRTDSTRISETAQTEARTYITEAYGTEYIGTEKKKETKSQMHKMRMRQFVLLR